MAAGVIGMGTGPYTVGVAAVNDANVPALMAWNYATTGEGDAFDARSDNPNGGAAVFAKTTSSSGNALQVVSDYASATLISASVGTSQPRTNVFNLAGNGNVLVTGNLSVGGTLSKGAGSFKIDHPLDPANKYLYHSFVESPDMKNIYDGVAVLNDKGEAWITLPEWFGALNRDFRYQLTSIGAFMPVYIAEEIVNNRFKIAGGKPGGKVSWLVTGIRQDAFANAHRIPVEEEKAGSEKGTYLHPESFENAAGGAGRE
jgi:hypothetical protein